MVRLTLRRQTGTDEGGRVDAVMLGDENTVLEPDEIAAFVRDHLADYPFDGRSVCVIVPDATRTCPLPLLLAAAHDALHGRVTRLTVLVALGTHPAMTQDALQRHVGDLPGVDVLNHEWWRPETFADLGTIPAGRLAELSGGRLAVDVPVRVNRAVVEHDVALVVGPVLPHEVVGMSGGTKYFFPGVGGQEIIDISHWLGALITSAEIIGTTGTTPVRALIDDAAARVPSEQLALSVVTADPDGVHAVAFGEVHASWATAARVCAATHVTYLDAPVPRVLSIVAPIYDDLWTAAKGFYKVEPVVADGGEVILYAPHVTEIAPSHPEIHEVGYHCRDYFLARWDRYAGYPWGVLAHSTHLRGAGTYDPATGQERLRVAVTLATAIPEDVCRAVNLGYRDPSTIDLTERADDLLVVPRAGEQLFRLRPGGISPPDDPPGPEICQAG